MRLRPPGACLLLAAGALAFLPGLAGAQRAPLQSGDHVRIHLRAPTLLIAAQDPVVTRLEGTLESTGLEGQLVFRRTEPSESDTVALDPGRVAYLDVDRGPVTAGEGIAHWAPRGAARGAVYGVVLHTLHWGTEWAFGRLTEEEPAELDLRAALRYTARGTLRGAVVGVLVGTVMGATEGRRWERIPLDRLHLAAAPDGGTTVGLSLTP